MWVNGRFDVGVVPTLQMMDRCGLKGLDSDGVIELLFCSLRRHRPADILLCPVKMMDVRQLCKKHILKINAESLIEDIAGDLESLTFSRDAIMH